nr:hypothetical protein [uncultured Porphyromonas sp.]
MQKSSVSIPQLHTRCEDEDVECNVFEEASRYFEARPLYQKIEDGYNYNEPPKGKRGENKEKRTLRELLNDPYRDSEALYKQMKDNYPFSEESFQLIEQDIRETRERISKDPLERVRWTTDGEPDFFSRRFADVVVRSVTAKELIEAEHSRDRDIGRAIRNENYRRLNVAFARRWKLPEGSRKEFLGSLFHCTPHEDKSGFVFAVRVPLHNAIKHVGAASEVTKEVKELLAKSKD